MDTYKELSIGVVSYYPQGRGFFGGIKKDAICKNDFRTSKARIVGETGENNARFLKCVTEIADTSRASSAQLAFSCVSAQQERLGGAGVVVILGTTDVKNLESNVASVDIEISTEEVETLEASDDLENPWENPEKRCR